VRGIRQTKRKKKDIGMANCNGDLEGLKSEGTKERREITKTKTSKTKTR